MKKWAVFLVSILSLSNVMCGFGAYDFDQDLFTKIEPEPSKIVGNYLPTEETMFLIRETGGYDLQNVSISLLSDGTFEMQNMPDWWMTQPPHWGNSKGGINSGRGTWSIVREDWWWQVELKFESGKFNSTQFGDGFYQDIDISGEQPPYTLWIYVGDRDRGRVMIFEQAMENI